MAASEVDESGEDPRVLAGFRAAYDPLYGPVLALGFLVQALAVLVGHVPLGVTGFLVGALADLATADEQNDLRGRLRRFGLGLLLRALLRVVLVYAVVLPAGVDRATLVLVTAGVVVLAIATRGYAWALGKVIYERPAIPVLNLGADLPLTGLFERLRVRRLYGSALIAAAEIPLVGAFLLGHLDVEVAALTLGAVTIATLLAVTARAVLWSRRFLRSDAIAAHVRDLEATIADTGARVVLYFSADRESTYQLNQWLPVFDQLDRPVLIVLREQIHLSQMLPTRHPVVLCRRHRDVEVALAADPLVVFYVGTAGRNIHFLRYGRPTHVFLNHGDSDKVSSANPVVKVYDKLFVAGPVAIERYREAGIDLGDDRFAVVGRPQLDRVRSGGQRIGDGPPTLLYAPTWEGYFEAADYSSLERLGPAMIRHILANRPDVRIVFKPHPASGTVRPAAGAAAREVTRILREAGAPHVLAADQPDLDLLDWFDRSDVLLSDISAVVTDFLATDKPYLVTNPRGLDLADFAQRFPSHDAAYVVARDLHDLDDKLAAAFGDDPAAADRARMKRRVLGDTPDGAMAAFIAALDETYAQAERHAERVVNSFAYDR